MMMCAVVTFSEVRLLGLWLALEPRLRLVESLTPNLKLLLRVKLSSAMRFKLLLFSFIPDTRVKMMVFFIP